MLIIFLTVLFCLAPHLVALAATFADKIQSDALIIAIGLFAFVILRVWFLPQRIASREALQAVIRSLGQDC